MPSVDWSWTRRTGVLRFCQRRETSRYHCCDVYSPECCTYLIKSTAQKPRPQITNAPTDVSYDKVFTVESPQADDVTKVTWVRLSSVTHAFNASQRINTLAFARTSGGLNVTAPADRNHCPPGHYMLFLLNEDGVPSISRTIRIQ